MTHVTLQQGVLGVTISSQWGNNQSIQSYMVLRPFLQQLPAHHYEIREWLKNYRLYFQQQFKKIDLTSVLSVMVGLHSSGNKGGLGS